MRVGSGRRIIVAATVILTVAVAAPSTAYGLSEPDLAAIGELAQEAQIRFETADYAGAIDLWTEAYAALPAELTFAQQRSALVYQIAQACVEAYAIDPQVLYLRKAERLYVAYHETLDVADTETLADVEATIEELREKIASAEPERDEDPSGDPMQREREDGEVDEEDEVDEVDEGAGAPAVDERGGRRLKIAGAALIGLGAASLGAMTYGLIWGGGVDDRGSAEIAGGETDVEVFRDLLKEGTTANRLAIGGGAAGAVAVVAGATLLGIGLRRTRSGRAKGDVAWAPLGLARGGGVSLQLRF